MKACPQCGMTNPDYAVSCECLYNFPASTIVRLPEVTAQRPSLPPMPGFLSDLFSALPQEVPILGVIGILFEVIGLYFLLVGPSVATTGDIVNLHRLTLGETFTIAGAIFVAAQWRPR